MRCKRDEEDWSSTSTRKRASWTNLNLDSKTVSPRSPQSSRNSAQFNLKISWEHQPRMWHKKLYQVSFLLLVDLEYLQTYNKARIFIGNKQTKTNCRWAILQLCKDSHNLLDYLEEIRICQALSQEQWQLVHLLVGMHLEVFRVRIATIKATWLELRP